MGGSGPFIFRAVGPAGGLGCGLALFFLGLFLLSPIAVLLIKGVGWILVIVGVVIAALALWAWFRMRR